MDKNIKAAAIITINSAADMTDEGARAIAVWIRQQAKYVLKNRKLFAKRFTARYLYDDKIKKQLTDPR